ncbi:hypothetical protein HPP92_009656 [Vanilla planifolia]|uniref:Uncharacterized protein n=1 Tax=Vanilla planifolia TaxID=51239 RepID=A0A835RGL7_VANPL|nr:hypothetical protein HPP92_009656 [Vanilla planifolia]
MGLQWVVLGWVVAAEAGNRDHLDISMATSSQDKSGGVGISPPACRRRITALLRLSAHGFVLEEGASSDVRRRGLHCGREGSLREILSHPQLSFNFETCNGSAFVYSGAFWARVGGRATGMALLIAQNSPDRESTDASHFR